MPEVPHHAFEITVSLDTHVIASWYDEIHTWLQNKGLWYAIKAEEGENAKCHVHAAIILEIVYKDSDKDKGGGMTAFSLKRSLKTFCPKLNDYMMDHPSARSLVVATMKSDVWISEYLSKEEELRNHKLPADTALLIPYFSDLQKDKPKNPEYDNWIQMYKDDKRPLPAEFEDIWKFFSYHMVFDPDTKTQLKAVADKKKLAERCDVMLAMVNQTDLPLPKNRASDTASNTTVKNGAARFCPRCIENDHDSPNMLGYREQFCASCKNY